ncbi:non-ribosomal peptide synthetase [Kitasatospora paranensis]|uniref:Non-ribosomal peptide synthetase n=2 Tax=Kitasatospora paranensis TaxID=258053 RepID=A0ABW2FX70_9ACTN
MVPATAGAGAGRPPAGPVAMLALAQLYVRDVPALRPPGRADLLQVLWCPFDHRPTGLPRTALFWRSVTAVAEILTAPPEPAAVQYDDYVPEPCLLAPEQVTEYPVAAELEPDLRAEVRAWSARQAVAAAPGSTGAGGGDDAYYDRELAVSPGWKVGGLPSWSATDPRPLHCCACGSRMQPMLTVASYEWQPNGPGWIPYEDRAAAAAPTGYPAPATPTMIGLAGGCNQQIYACPASPDHPHAELLQ